MKLVQFQNGKFGVRLHWWFGWHFRDLIDYPTYINRGRKFGSPYFKDCQGTREEAEKCLTAKSRYKIVSKKVPEENTIKHFIWKRKSKDGKRMIQL